MTGEDTNHEAAYYGLAAIAVAGICLLMAVPALHLASWLQTTGYPGWPESDKKLAGYGGYLGVLLIEILCLMGVVNGARGQTVAAQTGEPRVLCTTGLVLCLFAAAVWVGCGLAWHSQAWRFVRP
jgi:hypothetical protein